MSDQEKKQETNISPQPDADKKSELTEEELKNVSGGVPPDPHGF
jgi:bacteriocin-like protein